MQEMNEHQVIARKWRPQKFGDVVGQSHVIRTLRNAVAGNRVGHAYLLVGPRGIGKTTIARIFAKAINCEHPVDGEPCCECASCRSISEENSLDVIEIDAASRNSVDHMRALSEEAYHMPVASKYKIYIIDEVHMLSKAAWNALLKTVEEPPAHVKFIFATTEAHLVLPTIVSRCQRFDLRPIPGNLILERLKLIAANENVRIAPEALSAIARAAEGGMRDAQSSLEQMLSFFGGRDREIAADEVLELFGLTNASELDALLAALLQNQPEPVVAAINALARRGRNLETLFDDILEMLRGAELMRMLRNPETVLDFEEEKLARCRKLAALATPEVLRSFMESLTPVGRILHEALNKAIYLESILLKAMHEAHAPTVGDVLARLNQLRSAGELNFIAQVPSLQAMPLPVPVQVECAPAPAASMPPAAVPPETPPEVSPPPAAKAPPGDPAPEQPPPQQQQQPETAQTDSAPVSPEIEKAAATPLETLWNALTAGVLNAGGHNWLDGCSPLGLENSVLSVRVPAEALPILREHRLELLEILQKASGDWAILLDLQPFGSPETVSVPDTEIPPVAAEDSTPEMNFAPVETAALAVESDLPAPEAVLENALPDDQPVGEESEPDFSEPQAMERPELETEPPAEAFLTMPEDPNAVEPPDYAETELTERKRSVVNKPEEVEATAKLAPVKMILDLFNGEIVDIHA